VDVPLFGSEWKRTAPYSPGDEDSYPIVQVAGTRRIVPAIRTDYLIVQVVGTQSSIKIYHTSISLDKHFFMGKARKKMSNRLEEERT
jgi:hypothetical protein